MLRVLYVAYNLIMFPVLYVRRPIRLGISALVVNDEGHVLLVRHTYKSGWYFPGGGLERRESLEEGIRRELEEEVGLTVAGPMPLFGLYSNLGRRYSDHVALFLVRDFEMRPRKSAEIAEWAFFPPDALPENTPRGIRRRIDEFLGHREQSLEW